MKDGNSFAAPSLVLAMGEYNHLATSVSSANLPTNLHKKRFDLKEQKHNLIFLMFPG